VRERETPYKYHRNKIIIKSLGLRRRVRVVLVPVGRVDDDRIRIHITHVSVLYLLFLIIETFGNEMLVVLFLSFRRILNILLFFLKLFLMRLTSTPRVIYMFTTRCC